MNNKDLIKKYVGSTGLSIPEYQFNKLNNNLKTSYLRKRIQATQNSSKHYLKDYEIIALPDEAKINYINGLSDDNKLLMFQKSTKPKELYDEISNYGELQLSDYDFNHMLMFAYDTDGIGKIMIDYYDGDLGDEQINKILMNSLEPFNTMKLIKEKQPIELTHYSMSTLLKNSVNQDEISLIAIDYFKEDLAIGNILMILLYTKRPIYFDSLIRKYVDYELSDGQESILIGRGKNSNELKKLFGVEY